MNYRLYNARILTMQQDISIIENGSIFVENGLITYVGDKEPVQKPSFDREIDCKKNLLMPGFKDAHTHSAMTFLRSKADDLPLQDWLFNQVFPAEDQLTPDDIYVLTKLAIMEYLSSGITGIFDMYLTPETIAAACEDTGMRCVLVGGTCGNSDYEAKIKRMENFYHKWRNKNDLVTYQLGMHAEYTCDKRMIQEISACAHNLKAPMYMHLAETKREVLECKQRYQMSPVELLNENGIFDFGGGAFHCVHVTDHDIQILKEKSIMPVTNPGSNCKLASGIAPIAKFLEAGVEVAIGTDGAASNNCLDMFREMFLVTGLSKTITEDASSVSADKVLKMACCNGSRVCGLDDCDCLKEGKKADIIMIDLMQPNMQPIHNIAKNLVYSGSKQNVIMTMINGKILYENQEYFIGESKEVIYEKTSQICERIFGKS